MIEDRAKKIRLLLLDVDGVMTDGRIIYDSNGAETKFFNVKDGLGIKLVQRAGLKVGIISGRGSRVVEDRATELGIDILYQRVLDKLVPYREILESQGFTDDEVAFIGDDIIDLPILRRVGFAAAPADAMEDIFPHVHYVASRTGGMGAVREVCDLLLKMQGNWESATDRYLSR